MPEAAFAERVADADDVAAAREISALEIRGAT